MRLCPALIAALLLATASSVVAQPSPDAYMGHGISRELAVWHAKTVREVRYDLSLDVTVRVRTRWPQ